MGSSEKIYDVLILGGGIAGLTAAIYAGRAGVSALVIERGVFGGTIFQTSSIANYPGVLPDETGAGFSARLEAQAWSFGAERVFAEARRVITGGGVKEVVTGDGVFRGKTLIIAAGIGPVKLGIPGEEEYTGLGVSYCAICDAPFFAGRDVYVAGGGNNALEESLRLAKVARHVTVVHKRDAFHASKEMVEKAKGAENISFLFDTAVVEVGGEGLLRRIVTENTKTGERRSIDAGEGESLGLFVFAGMKPMSDIYGETLESKNGFIVTDEAMRTNLPGVFAAGDIRHKKYRQALTAASDGAIAALSAEQYLMEVRKNGE